jgi:hypothetical protein
MPSATADLTHLDRIDNVSEDYRHISKLITPGDDVALPDAHLKWYDVRKPERVIPDEVQADARAFLKAETESGRLAISGELGFTLLHLCGDSFFFLIVCTWRNNNEMWETVYAKDTKDGGPFKLVPQDTHMEVICVWELGAVVHEQQAWTRYLRSARDHDAKVAYIEDRFSGSV